MVDSYHISTSMIVYDVLYRVLVCGFENRIINNLQLAKLNLSFLFAIKYCNAKRKGKFSIADMFIILKSVGLGTYIPLYQTSVRRPRQFITKQLNARLNSCNFLGILTFLYFH